MCTRMLLCQHCRYKVIKTFVLHEKYEVAFDFQVNFAKKIRVMIRTQTMAVTGMSCATCAISIEKSLNALEGVKAQVNFASRTALVNFEEAIIRPEDLRLVVQGAGYDLLWDTGDEFFSDMLVVQQKEYDHLKRQTLWAIALTLPVVVLAMFFPSTAWTRRLMMFFSFPVLFIWGRDFFIRAWGGIRQWRFGMDVLVALSTSMAFLYSFFNTLFPDFFQRYQVEPHVYFETASVIISFILLGKTLEGHTRIKATYSVRKFLNLQAKEVVVLEQGRDVSKPMEAVQIGDLIRVKSGEKIPVDGTIVSGNSYIDESMITGESISVFKDVGDRLFSGTINQGGSFEMKTEKIGSHTLLAEIIRVVRQAQDSKAPVQKITDRIAGIFVPVLVSISVVVFFVWGFSSVENSWLIGLSSMMTVLIIACPCALGLAVPTALIAAVGRAAEDGILVKDAESLERAHRINTLILDKTGTLTEGRPAVKEVFWLDGFDSDKYVADLVALERRSTHPLAQAILMFFDGYYPSNRALLFFKENPGNGVEGLLGENKYRVGSLSWLEANGVVFDGPILDKINDWRARAYTFVGFAENERLLAVFSIIDSIKEDAYETIDALNRLGIEIHMLTGDHLQAARFVADELGIRHYNASQLPSDKMNFIKELQQKGNIVAMTGDGINDAQALAQADLSLAMARGSDVAIDASGITLLGSDLRKIPKVLHLSKYTMRTIRQNLFWAFVYNVVSIPMAAGALYPIKGYLLDPMFAAAAMAISSVSVVFNSLRLRNKRLL